MTAQGYPEQLDVMWAASDRDGQIAVFFSAGEGPIAKSFLDYEDFEQEELEAHMLDLPRRGNCIMTSEQRIKNDEWLAEVGCYVFDWSDVHRVSGRLHAYELRAMPSVPLRLEDLPPDVRKFLSVVRLPDGAFGASAALDVEAQVECLNTRYRMPSDDLPVRKDGPPVQHPPRIVGHRPTSSGIFNYLRRLLPR